MNDTVMNPPFLFEIGDNIRFIGTGKMGSVLARFFIEKAGMNGYLIHIREPFEHPIFEGELTSGIAVIESRIEKVVYAKQNKIK